jgi:GT2 family glycosyltransferase
MERFADWARGRLALIPEPGPLRSLSHPPVAKPVPFAGPELGAATLAHSANTPLILLQTGANLGYGGGNNVGIRYALDHLAFDYLWILNNDTLVAPDALEALLHRVTDTDIDICGSTLLFHDRPEIIQCQGGAHFYRWLSLTRLLGIWRTKDNMLDQAQVEARLDHPYGAAMLISRAGLDKLGPMPEGYFLYYEEIDWIAGAATPVRLGYAPDSIVYHRKGRAAGTGIRRDRRSRPATYYLARNRIRYTARRFPFALPLVCGFEAAQCLLHLVRGDWPRAMTVMRALLGRPPTATEQHHRERS